jgi:tetratricopeptide (TPR) repeat protein
MSFDDELERAWALLEAGDESGARRLAEKLHGEDPGHPDVLLIQAACCRQTGAIEEALQLLEQAAQADLNWAAPEIWAAEILAEDPERLGEALQHAAAALDRAEEEDEFLEALALKAGLEIDVGKPTAARKTLAELPPLQAGAALPSALALDFAHLFLEVGDVDEATQRFRRWWMRTTAMPTPGTVWAFAPRPEMTRPGSAGLGCACWRWIPRSRWRRLSCRKRRWQRWLRPPCASCRNGCAS